MNKTILAAMLAIAAIFVLGAAGSAGSDASAESNVAVDSGGTYYTSLSDAVTGAPEGGTITLLSNISVDQNIQISKNLTIDLHGFTISNLVTAARMIDVVEAVSFTIVGNGGGMTIPSTNTGSYGFVKIAAAATVTIDGGTYEGGTDNGSFFRIFSDGSGASLTLDGVVASTSGRVANSQTVQTMTVAVIGGSYESEGVMFGFDMLSSSGGVDVRFEGVTATTSTGPIIETAGGVATYDECSFTCTGQLENFYNTAVAVSFGGVAVINSGSYTAGHAAYVYSSGGTITINGGTFTGSVNVLRADTSEYYGTFAYINVYGGTFKGTLKTSYTTTVAVITLYAGAFDADDATDYMADGSASARLSPSDGMTYIGSVESSGDDGLSSVLAAYLAIGEYDSVTIGSVNADSLDLLGLEGYTIYNGSTVPVTVDGKQVTDGGIVVYGFDVTFETNGGSSVSSQVVVYGGYVSEPSSPTRSGYSFGGWYTDSELTDEYDFSTAVASDITLYAKWTANPFIDGGDRRYPANIDNSTTGSTADDSAKVVACAAAAVAATLMVVFVLCLSKKN